MALSEPSPAVRANIMGMRDVEIGVVEFVVNVVEFVVDVVVSPAAPSDCAATLAGVGGGRRSRHRRGLPATQPLHQRHAQLLLRENSCRRPGRAPLLPARSATEGIVPPEMRCASCR